MPVRLTMAIRPGLQPSGKPVEVCRAARKPAEMKEALKKASLKKVALKKVVLKKDEKRAEPWRSVEPAVER